MLKTFKSNPAKKSFNLKKCTLQLLTGLTLGSLAMSQIHAQDKAAFVYIGPTSDHGWTYSHDQGRIKAEKALAGKYKTTLKMYQKLPMQNVLSAIWRSRATKLFLQRLLAI